MGYKCSCCGYYTLREEIDDICQVCAWQEDIIQKENPDYIGGPNEVSLNQARKNYRIFGASNEKFIEKVRKPFLEEFPEQKYIIEFKHNAKTFYCIWYTGDKDGFILKNGKIFFHQDENELREYCKNNNISCEKEKATYDIKEIQEYYNSVSMAIDCALILSFWNIVTDIAQYTKITFVGNLYENTDIYNKLFYGNNLPSINSSDKKYVPNWETSEIIKIKEVIKNGLEIIDNVFQI